MPIKISPLPIALLLAIPLWLAACRSGNEPQNGAGLSNVTVIDQPAVLNAAPAESVDPTSQAVQGEPGARAVLDGWARALERRDWAAARGAWGHDGADSGLDPVAFAHRYDRYAAIAISVGEGEGEGAAGSLYYRAPVIFTARLRDGRQVRMEGPVTLRRVNDVDGASAADLRWHISMSDLKSRP